MKKCIVLDLDNTLWGGIVGEEGPNGLALSLQPPGSYFLAFQQALRDLYDRGVILAINSKNNPDDALTVIREHPNMILKENHFAASRINWNDKTENMRALAKELNIGLDSMVFLDDSLYNRADMRAALPEVETPDLPTEPSRYAKFLHSLPYFATEAITDEDKMRGNLYVTERLRKEAEKKYPERTHFLQSLQTELRFFVDEESSLARLSQLTEKTNQFNSKKWPLSEEQIRDYMRSKEVAVFYAKALDQFGDQGIIAFALVSKTGKNWNIESLLLSCRVLGRGIEEAFVGSIGKYAAERGVQTISVSFTPTEKNKPAEEFIKRVWSAAKLPVEKLSIPDWIEIRHEEVQ